MVRKSSAILFLIITLFSVAAFAGYENHNDDNNANENSAFAWNFTYIADFWTGLQGGLKGFGRYLGNADLQLTIDNDKLFHLKGNTILLEIQNLNGQKPNRLIKSYQDFDNIDYTFVNTTKIYQLWMSQAIGEHWSILGGIYDLNSEFYVTDSAATLIGPSYSIGWEFAQTGKNGPSIYPTPGSAIRVKYVPNDAYYLLAGLFNAVAGDVKNPRYAHTNFSTANGFLSIVEGGHNFANGKIGIGVWTYTQKSPTLANTAGVAPHDFGVNAGFYGLIDYPLYQDPKSEDRILHGFMHFGMVNSHVNNFKEALVLGLAFNGLLKNRLQDIFSIGYSPAWTTSYARRADTTLPAAEVQYEITYAAQINKWFTFQPDLQYIKFNGNPDSSRKNSINLGVRLIASI